MKRVKSVCSCGLEEHTEYEDVPEMKFKSWAEWRKLPVEKRWEALQGMDRLSYDHSASWIEGAMDESRRENEAKRLEWVRTMEEANERISEQIGFFSALLDNNNFEDKKKGALTVFRVHIERLVRQRDKLKALAETMKDGTR